MYPKSWSCDHMLLVPEIQCGTDVILIFHFGLFFALLPLPRPTPDRQTDKQTDRQAEADRQTGRQADRQTGRQEDRQTGRQEDRKTGRQADRQTDRQTRADRKSDIEMGVPPKKFCQKSENFPSSFFKILNI